MAAYIHQDFVAEKIRKEYDSASGNAHTAFGIALEYILHAPKVEAAPIIHAHWIQHDTTWKCSRCHEENCYAWDDNIKQFTDLFCPACGALMDEFSQVN